VTRAMAPRMSDVREAVGQISASLPDDVEEIQRTRRLPDRVVEDLRRSGINRLLMPTELGGLQASVLDVMDVIEDLAAADGSTAWCAAIGSGSNFFAGYMGEPGARTVFADPDQGNATMFAPAGRLVDDGGVLRLRGRWPFTSNCLHSAWAGLGALVERDGQVADAPVVAFVPIADLTIDDTWDTAGLRGTGSHHVAADGIEVDADHCCSFTDTPWPEGTLWRLPLYAALFPTLAAVPLGIARGALDEIGRQVREGRVARRGDITDDPISLAEFAAADSRLRGARAALREALGEVHVLAAAQQPAPRSLQARICLACIQASDTAVEVTSVAHHIGGGSAAYRASTLLRALGDVQASRQHLLFAPKHRSELAKILAGVETSYLPFVR
jgi:indole-3-acetate monooxygenase